jgi:hypothetical protein
LCKTTGWSAQERLGRADEQIEHPVEEKETHALELSFEPCLESVTALRRFLEVHYGRLDCDARLISRMAVTVHELLENAAKYSSGGGSRLRVEVDPARPRTLMVSVANHADPRHLPGLQETIAELSSAEDPLDVYQRYLLRAATRDEGSGLGLARIRVEADMSVAIEYQDNTICIRAAAAR